jgi:rhamnulose-1-phosphate aldolase/alcohol dehydrogenase
LCRAATSTTPHPDAVIAIAATRNSRELTKRIYGDEIGWLPWKRPGFELGLWLENFARENPNAKGCVLGSHGLFTWADDARTCYELTLDIINRAIRWFERETAGKPVFGGHAFEPLPAERRREIAARLMPEVRGRIGAGEPKVGHFDDSPEVLDFVTSNRLPELAAMGTSCPDHFLRTKIRPLVLDFDPASADVDGLVANLDQALQRYRDDYAAYYDRAKHPDSPKMRDPNAVVYLVPGVGMITFARDKPTARISAEFYINAINVMRGASTVGEYVGLDEQEAFNIEYWLLEEAKLQRMPKPKSLAGRVAYVTGGAGGIGRATAERLIAEGACVVLADIDEPSLQSTLQEFSARHGADAVRGVLLDVTSEADVIRSFVEASREYGGLDIIVSNAGISSSAAVEDTELSMWQRNMDILATGYFLVSREGLPPLQAPEARRSHRLRRLQERAGRLARRRCLLHCQGLGDPPRPLSRAGGRARRDSRQRGEPRRRPARLEDLAGRMARTARRSV